MKQVTIILAFLTTFSSTVAAQDYQEGYDAFMFGDDAKALRILRPLAAQGHAEAQKMLGTMYQFGHGVIEDHKAALEWYRLSAIQGNNDGQHGLGVMYMQGIATIADNTKSHMWFNIGSANGHSQSAYWRDKVELKMTPADISKAQAMARECMNSGYTKCGY